MVTVLRDFEKRKQLWDLRDNRGPRNGHDLRDSLPYPFETVGIQMIFDDKDVLEIGPGNGRQYERVKDRCKTCSILDLSPAVLKEPVFSKSTGKYLLEDWDQSLGRLFDVVHFWYVLHHIRQDELRSFFDLIARHLRHGGLVCFNSPQPINVQGLPEGDGIGTTWTDPYIVQVALPSDLEMIMALNVDKNSTGFVFMLRKI